MAYPTTVNFQSTSPIIGSQPIHQASTTQVHPLGTLIRAMDYAYGEGEFIYCSGVASCAQGDLVAYNSKTGAIVRAVHAGTGSSGPVGVAAAALVAGTYGWVQISGSCPVKSATVAANGQAYLTSTAGQVDDAVVASDRIEGMRFKSADSSGYATVQLDRPAISDAGGETYGTASVDANGKITFEFTDGSGTSGDQTINKVTGLAKIAALGQAITITNNRVSATSLIIAWQNQTTPDATLGAISTLVGTGNFTIKGTGTATADTVVGFLVIN